VLRTNLSTRPFYNERAVHWGLALALVAILALTAFNVSRVLALSQQQSVLATAAERDEAQARALVSDAASLRASIDQKALEHVVHAAEEANEIIDERTFSWTELLNHIERTLPPSVMLTAVTPHADKGQVKVSLIVLGRSVETVDDFIDKMEGTKAFSDMSPLSEHITEAGLYEVTITGTYHPGVAAVAPEPPEKDKEKDKDKEHDESGDETGAGKPTPAPPRSSTPPPAAKRGMAS
jgi:Tfp pilus assembly protein PilN